MSIPNTLYTYASPGGIGILRDLELHLNRPSNFNDLFDCSPGIPCDPNAVLQDRAATAFGNPPAGYLRSQGIFKQLLRFTHLACLTTTPSNPLLWAYYTNNHEGMAVGLNKQLLEGESLCLRVKYKMERPTFANELGDLFAYFATKSTVWKHEKEVRLFVVHMGQNDSRDKRLKAAKAKPDKLALKLSPQTVESVVFGYRVKEDTLVAVLNELKKPHFSHVKKFRIRPCSTSFEFKIEPIK